MDWRISLDKYLTTSPEDFYHEWCEDLACNKISDGFYSLHEKWVDEYDGQFNAWMIKLFNDGKSTELAAKIIERAFYLYRLDKKDRHHQ